MNRDRGELSGGTSGEAPGKWQLQKAGFAQWAIPNFHLHLAREHQVHGSEDLHCLKVVSRTPDSCTCSTLVQKAAWNTPPPSRQASNEEGIARGASDSVDSLFKSLDMELNTGYNTSCLAVLRAQCSQNLSLPFPFMPAVGVRVFAAL